MSELRKYLTTVDPDLAQRLGEVWRKARSGIHDAVQTKEGHVGGLFHSEAVEHNVWRLIPKEWRNTDQCRPVDLFLLSAAAALHDAGRVPFGGDFDPDLDHGQLSEKRIRANPGKFELSQHEADVVGMIVRPHNDGDLSTLEPEGWPLNPHGMIDVRKLAALLRLGDILHIAGRVSSQVIDSSELTGKARAKTLFRELVADWDLVEDRQAIRLFASTATTEEYDVVFGGVEVTARDLEPIAAALQSCGLPHRFTTPKVNTDKMKWAEEERAKEARALIGLDYFHENDAEAFKGRDNEIAELQQRVIGNHVSLLVGASGAGKTSLILAGLLPKMRRAGWLCVRTRPWLPTASVIRPEDFRDSLGFIPADDQSLTEILERLSVLHDGRDVLVCLDQFEDAVQLMSLAAGKDLRHTLSTIQSGRYPKICLLIAYRVEAESTFGRAWQEIAGSASGLPRMYLNPLDRLGAERALKDALQRGRTDLHSPDGLAKLILDDLESETYRSGHGSGVYPPYIRILAETMVNRSRVTHEIFSSDQYNELGGASKIIGEYLLKALDQLGDKSDQGKRVLVALTSSSGTKSSRSVDELSAEARVAGSELVGLLSRLTALRLVRCVGSEYEIAHDYLADLICRELAGESGEELQFKALREMLAAKARSYESIGGILSSDEVLALYPHRTRIVPSRQEQGLVLRSLLCLHMTDPVPGWYWLQDFGRDQAREVLYLMMHQKRARVRRMAVEALGKLGEEADLSRIEPFLQDSSWYVRRAAIQAFGRLGSADNLHTIEPFLLHDGYSVREAAKSAVENLKHREGLSASHEPLATVGATTEPVSVDIFGASVHSTGSDVSLPVAHGRIDTIEWEKSLQSADTDILCAKLKALNDLGIPDHLPMILPFLHHPDADVCEAAERARDKLGYLATLSERMRYGRRRHDRLCALTEFSFLCTSGNLSLVEPLLASPNVEIRAEAVKLFGCFGDDSHLPKVIEVLYDRNKRVHAEAAEAFVKLANRDDIDRLMDDCTNLPREVLAYLDRIAYLPSCFKPLFDDVQSFFWG